MKKIKMKNLPAESELKTWILATRADDGKLTFFYTTDSIENAARILEWYAHEMVMVHKDAVVMTDLEKMIMAK